MSKINKYRLNVKVTDDSSPMSDVDALKELSERYMNDARFHLDAAREILDSAYRGYNRSSYEGWKKRNDSGRISSTLLKEPAGSASNTTFTLGTRFAPPKIVRSRPKRTLTSDPKSKPSKSQMAPPIETTIPTSLHTVDFVSDSENSDSSTSDIDETDYVDFLYRIQSSDLKRLKDFRDKYFFECHSVGHRCSHDFKLNDRLFFEPVYADHEGVSRCRECHLPLHIKSSRKIHLCKMMEKQRSDTDNESNSSHESDSECPEISVKFPYNTSFVIPQKKTSSKSKVPGHNRDSMALRHQKGFREIS